jgi:NAD-dependent oxidoreductase involved in siderophore biosynthesis
LEVEFGVLYVEEESMLRGHVYDFIADLLQIADSRHKQFVEGELRAIVAYDVLDVLGLSLAHKHNLCVVVDARHHFQTVHQSAPQVEVGLILGLVYKHFDGVAWH